MDTAPDASLTEANYQRRNHHNSVGQELGAPNIPDLVFGFGHLLLLVIVGQTDSCRQCRVGVSVGTNHDTASFTVNATRQWWWQQWVPCQFVEGRDSEVGRRAQRLLANQIART
jgi:hypothetical protein